MTPVSAGVVVLPWEQDSAPSEPEGWLLSFVDVLTLLLTLFVLLLAYQKSANEELQGALLRVPARIQQADQPPVPAVHATPPLQIATATVTLSEQAPEDPAQSAASHDDEGERQPSLEYLAWFAPEQVQPDLSWLPLLLEASVEARLPEEPIPAPFERLLAQLSAQAIEGAVEIHHAQGQVNLEVSERILFAPASADLLPDGRALLDRLLPALLSDDYQLSVEGHTDNVPIRSPRFPSNWELSAARATTVTRHLIEIGVRPERIRAVGYADTRPLADNGDTAGRARNRRVSFVLQALSS